PGQPPGPGSATGGDHCLRGSAEAGHAPEGEGGQQRHDHHVQHDEPPVGAAPGAPGRQRRVGYTWPGLPPRGSGRRPDWRFVVLYVVIVALLAALTFWRVARLR
ncbi:hypothetical protein AB4212_45840, partial [Streptomyces sp. 2MCAF27]